MRIALPAVLAFALTASPAFSGDPDPYKSAENMHSVSTAMQVIGIVAGLGAAGTGVAAYIDYDQYKRSTSPAETESLRKQIITFDKITVIAGIVSGVFITGGIVTYVMYRNKIDALTKPKYKPAWAPEELQFAVAPVPGGGVLGLNARF